MIQPGNPAIHFGKTDVHDQPTSLGMIDGKKMLLTFLRDTSGPFCDLRIHKLIGNFKAEIGNTFNTIAVFSIPKEEILKYEGRQDPPFTIIADPQFEWYKKYGVQKSFMGKLRAMLRFSAMFEMIKNGIFTIKSLTRKNTLPADFLINEDGTIDMGCYGMHFGDHAGINTLSSWIESAPLSTVGKSRISQNY
jgi:peroxiredoxin